MSFLFIISFLLACIEEYRPNIDKYLDLPVVEGMITNEPGPYIVKLSRSLSVYDMDYEPISGAIIKIYDNLDNEVSLKEIEDGVYSTNKYGIRGIVGRKYRISVIIGEIEYQSEFEELKEPIGIDSVYAKVESRVIKGKNISGVQFYINTKSFDKINSYFLWKPIETYEYKASLAPNFIHYGPHRGNIIEIISNPANTCWHTKKINNILIYTTELIKSDFVNSFALNYVDNKTKKLTERYSLLVNQYSISKANYEYWNNIKKQNIDNESFYSKQPFQIIGNLVNTDNSKEIILGYFMVAGVSKKRIFINRPQMIFDLTEKCEPTTDILREKLENTWTKYPLYGSIIDGEYGTTLSSGCYDCREAGGTLEKPDFWDN